MHYFVRRVLQKRPPADYADVAAVHQRGAGGLIGDRRRRPRARRARAAAAAYGPDGRRRRAVPAELAGGADAVLVVGDRRRSPRTVLPGPFLARPNGRRVPVGWVPDTGWAPSAASPRPPPGSTTGAAASARSLCSPSARAATATCPGGSCGCSTRAAARPAAALDGRRPRPRRARDGLGYGLARPSTSATAGRSAGSATRALGRTTSSEPRSRRRRCSRSPA